MIPITDSWKQLLAFNALLLTFYIIYGAVYRLYLSPIAKFPGPRLAALTHWYEFYYDNIEQGKYIFKIRDLHKRYGTSPFRYRLLHSLTFSALLGEKS